MEKEDTQKLVLSVEEARHMLGLSRGSMYQAINSGQVPAIRIGRRLLISKARLEQLINGSNKPE
ncbi:helix-turn-helix domain-containing protein [Chloroflexota bacterium]